MTNDNFRTGDNDDRGQETGSRQSLDNNALDVELDAVLAKYAAVEPRTGLEERVLANLRAERGRAPAYGWWRWSVFAATAAVLLVALTFLLRSGELRRENVARRPARATQDGLSKGTQGTTNGGSKQIRVAHPVSGKQPVTPIHHRAQSVAASGPRWDQFPSLRPLSEQEKILQDYVVRYPGHAALIAQARAEALRQDLAEEMKDASAREDFQQ